VRIPTTVVVELEGLAKAVDPVRSLALAALAWLRDRPRNTKCVTSKGTLLSNFGLLSEEDCSDGQKNDDRILACCLRYLWLVT
jgi:hypothetical protein